MLRALCRYINFYTKRLLINYKEKGYLFAAVQQYDLVANGQVTCGCSDCFGANGETNVKDMCFTADPNIENLPFIGESGLANAVYQLTNSVSPGNFLRDR